MLDEERKRLYHQLIKLGDMIGDGLHYEDSSISKEYRRIIKLLHPEMFPPRKKRKPSNSILKTLKPCDCGSKGWKLKEFKAKHEDRKRTSLSKWVSYAWEVADSIKV